MDQIKSIVFFIITFQNDALKLEHNELYWLIDFMTNFRYKALNVDILKDIVSFPFPAHQAETNDERSEGTVNQTAWRVIIVYVSY